MWKFFLILSLSAPTPNKFGTAGSQKKMGSIFSSGQKIQTWDGWVGSVNATSVLCHPPILSEAEALKKKVQHSQWQKLFLFIKKINAAKYFSRCFEGNRGSKLYAFMGPL